MRLQSPILIGLLSTTQYLLTHAWQVQWRLGELKFSSRRPSIVLKQEENVCQPFTNGNLDPERPPDFRFNIDRMAPGTFAPEEFLLHHFIVLQDKMASASAFGDPALHGFLFYPPTSDKNCQGDPVFYLLAQPQAPYLNDEDNALIPGIQDAHITTRLKTPLGYYRAVYKTEADTIYKRLLAVKDGKGLPIGVKIEAYFAEDGTRHPEILIPMKHLRPTAYYAKKFDADISKVINSDIKETTNSVTKQKELRLVPHRDLKAVNWADPALHDTVDALWDIVFPEKNGNQASNEGDKKADEGMDLESDGVQMELNNKDQLEKMKQEQDMATLRAHMREMDARKAEQERQQQEREQ